MVKKLILFDVDNTLTVPRKQAKPEMSAYLQEMRTRYKVGLVGGSDLTKQKEQMGDTPPNFDYVFAENGLHAFKDGKEIHRQSMVGFMGQDKMNKLINFILRKMSEIEIPIKRGTFIEHRTGMMNISPIGRQCSQEERDSFEVYDKEHGIRTKLRDEILAEFGESYGLAASIGGQISIDLFPKGWDKTYCLQFVENEGFDEIHFFGDKTDPGGNDYEIYTDKRTIGHSVKNCDECLEILKKEFKD